MTIDQLKTEWRKYDQKLSVSQQLNEQLITSMLKERSRSRIAKINRNNIALMVLMLLNLVLLAGIFFGNPFDFRYSFQFIPYGILAIGVFLAIISLIKSLKHFSVDINAVNLGSFLKATIEEYERNKKMQGWFGLIMFSAGVLTVFSFLPKKLETNGLWPALGETGIMIGITVAIYFIAFRLGAFKEKKKEAFENDWKEFQQLKALSAELGVSGK